MIQTYRAILSVGPNRHVVGAKDFDCTSEEEAINKAKQLVDDHKVELWNRGRFIACFVPRAL